MRKHLCSLFLAALVLNLLWLSPAGAQERKGAITGRVADKERALLPGARVELQPGGRNATSDGQGQFTIGDLTPGHYTLTISYVGFEIFSSQIDVAAGGVANVDAVLEVGARNEVVEVRAERQQGEVEALNIQRTADNILQVLPKEVITSLPNTNIADAVGRMPSVSLERDEGEGKYVQIRGMEPRLNNVTVDGVHLPSPENVRNVKLDAIPADLVEMVQLSKTLSANQEGDAIGGSVNLVTKSASDKPYISALGMGGYTPIAGGRSLDQFDLTMGQRFFKNKQLGILAGGSYDWNGRGIDDVEPSVGVNPLPGGGSFSGVNAYDQREYWYNRTRFGFGGTLDYKLGDWSSFYIRGLFSQFKDDGQDWIYSPSVGSFNTPTLTNPDGSSTFSHITRKPAQRLFSTTAGAHQTLGGNTLLDYEAAFGQARFTGFFPSSNFAPIAGSPLAGGVQYSLNASDPFTPVLTALNTNIFNPTQYGLFQLTRGDDHTFERDVTGSINLLHNYNAGSHFSTFQMGFKIRDAHKSELDNQQTFRSNNLTLDPANGPGVGVMNSFLGSFTNPNYYFGAYPKYGPTTNYASIINFLNANPSLFSNDPLADAARTLAGDFNEDERVIAGYVMNTINFGGRFRLQAGVRIEGTQGSFMANQVQTINCNDPSNCINRNTPNNDPNSPFGPNSLVGSASEVTSVTPVAGNQNYISVLPSIQFQSRFGQDTTLRLAYTIGIARPNFGDLAPHTSIDQSVPLGRQSPSVFLGNSNLQPTRAQNFDVLFEHYLKPFGAIEAGFFYKYLTNPIFSVDTPLLTSGPFAGRVESQPINGPHAHLFGFEMAWQQRLSFLPGFLNGSGVRANYSYTQSATTFPVGAFGADATLARSDQPALQRDAPNNWNFDYTYDKKGVSARMGLTHNDASIFFYNFTQGAPGGIRGPNGDTYLYPHTQVDAQVSYWIPGGHGLQIIGYVLNLTNETFGFYQGSEQFPIQREYYNRTFSGGLRWTLGRENH
ncbi:MAG TPA: TonB-dependent receptor [Candidatus Angelobacter sp.]|nr:TonB-dependent receptor [Candidatus Angelobacter sp.]